MILEMLNLVSNNNYIYMGIIIVLVIIIIITVFSMKKDREKLVNKKKEIVQPIEPAKTPEEQEHARMELEKVVNTMKNDIANNPNPSPVVTYEQDQEDKAIISYKELVEAVKSQNVSHQPQSEVGMEVAETSVIEEPTTVEEKIAAEESEARVDNIIDMINSVGTSKKEEVTNEEIKPLEETKQFEEVKADVVDVEESSTVSLDESLDLDEKKFQTSEFISPIYGRQPQGDIKPVMDIPKEEPKHAAPSLDDVINNDATNSEEFLESLKNFRNSL